MQQHHGQHILSAAFESVASAPTLAFHIGDDVCTIDVAAPADRLTAAVLADAGAYLHIVLPALPLAFVEAIAASAFQGAGDTRTPLYVATLGNVVNVTLSALLIFGSLGLPALGIRGAAIGTAATMSIEGLLLGGLLLSRKSPLPLGGDAPPFGLRERLSLTRLGWGGEALRRVLRVSAPTFGEKLVNQSAYLAFVAMIGLLGPEAMAGNQALVAIEAICFLTADGFGVAAGATLARKLGAGKPDEATRAGWMAAFMATAWLSSMGLLFALLPRLLMRGFTSDPAIITLGAQALYVAAIAQPFMAFATVLGTGLRGAGDTRRPEQIPESERDYYLERKYPSYGNLSPRDIASRAAKQAMRKKASLSALDSLRGL